jgi:hypothetical protein
MGAGSVVKNHQALNQFLSQNFEEMKIYLKTQLKSIFFSYNQAFLATCDGVSNLEAWLFTPLPGARFDLILQAVLGDVEEDNHVNNAPPVAAAVVKPLMTRAQLVGLFNDRLVALNLGFFGARGTSLRGRKQEVIGHCYKEPGSF